MTADPSRHRAPYVTDRPAATAEARRLAPPASIVAEPAPQEYSIETAWIDTAGRTRTWALRDPQGAPVAEITTKSAALKLADLLNRVTNPQREPTL